MSTTKFSQTLTCLLVNTLLLANCFNKKNNSIHPYNGKLEKLNVPELPIATHSEQNFFVNIALNPQRVKPNKIEIIEYEPNPLGAFESLPNEILNLALSYVGSKAMGKVRKLNRNFYTYTTNYQKPGQMVSQYNINQAMCYINNWGLNTRTVNFRRTINFLGIIGITIDFGRKKHFTPNRVMSLPFFQLTGKVTGISQEFWPYIKYTQIHTLDLTNNKIGSKAAIELIEEIKYTQVHTLILTNNRIGSEAAIKLIEQSKNNNLYTICLKNNQIGPVGAVELVKNLRGTQIHILNLDCNQIGSQGAIELIKNLRGTQIHTLGLGYNQIGPGGAVELAKNLRGTQIHTLGLGYNQIGPEGVVELAKNLRGTQIHTLDLEENRIGSNGAIELIKNLIGTQVHTLNLIDNQIDSEGAIELAKNLQDTNLRAVYLGCNYIDSKTYGLLNHLYPHIQWHFDY